VAQHAAAAVAHAGAVLPALLAAAPRSAARPCLLVLLRTLLHLQGTVGDADGGARYYVVAQLVTETVRAGAAVLAAATDGSSDMVSDAG
jgi:hypothetical protein